jgi:outer membrane protein assembly factor BamB
MTITIRRLMVLLVAVCAAEVGEGSESPRDAASLPRSLSTDDKWEALQRDRPTPGDIQSLINEDSGGKNIVACPDGVYRSAWSAVDQRLRQDAEAVRALRLVEDAEAAAALGAARRSGDPDRMLAACRRYPWAAASHTALLDCGEQMLRAGQAHAALRCFQDVLLRSDDPAARARAQDGEKLAAAHLVQDAGVSKPPRPDSFKTPTLQLPKEPAWIVEFDDRLKDARRGLFVPQRLPLVPGKDAEGRDGLLVAGPNLLAWYAADQLDKPRWQQTAATGISAYQWNWVAPGEFQPTITGGRIFTRWGIETAWTDQEDVIGANRRPNRLKDIVALDAATGRILWSKAADPDWQDFYPVNDPVYADGRLYLLAARMGRGHCVLSLVSLDADSGAVLWRRELVSFRRMLAPADDATAGKRRQQRGPVEVDWKTQFRDVPWALGLDLVQFGNPVTVVGGAVYCSTSTGVVARCDARDGLIEWIAQYPQNPEATDLAALARRQGAAPIVAGPRVIFTPRDTSGVIAVDRETGAVAWQALTDVVPPTAGPAARGTAKGRRPVDEVDLSLEALAVADDTLLAAVGGQVVALDSATGKPKSGPLPKTVPNADWLLAVRAGLQPVVRQQDVQRDEPEQTSGRWRAPRQAVRQVYLTARGPAIDGDPSSWEPENTAAWKLPDGTEGRTFVGYDEANLYLGISCPASEAAPRIERGMSAPGNWLELRFFGGRLLHAMAAVDGRGRASLQPIGRRPLPAGSRAAVLHRISQDGSRLTYEVAIPLADLWGEAYAPYHDEWRRIGVAMTVHGGSQSSRAEDTVQPGRVVEALYLHPVPIAELAALESIARRFPDLEESWEFLWHRWEPQAPGSSKLSDFYRRYIDEHPGAPELESARARLEASLQIESGTKRLPGFKQVEPVAYKADEILAVMEAKLPGLPFSNYASKLWRRADRLLLDRPGQRTALRRAILTKAAAADVPRWLGAFFYASADEKDCVTAMERLIVDCRLAESVLTDFRTNIAHAYIRTWQVIGPFSAPGKEGLKMVFPVENEAISLDRAYDGLRGKVRWQRHHDDSGRIDLWKPFGHSPSTLGYAVCWIHPGQKRTVAFQVRTDDGIKVWVNRQLILTRPAERGARPTTESVNCELASDWNVVLVKLDTGGSDWCFYPELRDPATGRPIEGFAVRAEPPSKENPR